MTLKIIRFPSSDEPVKEILKQAKETFRLHKFKYIDNTMTLEERQVLSKCGTKFQQFKDGKRIESTEEYTHFVNNQPASKALQAWFKYQDLLKEEEEARKLENRKRASEIERPIPYTGQ